MPDWRALAASNREGWLRLQTPAENEHQRRHRVAKDGAEFLNEFYAGSPFPEEIVYGVGYAKNVWLETNGTVEDVVAMHSLKREAEPDYVHTQARNHQKALEAFLHNTVRDLFPGSTQA